MKKIILSAAVAAMAFSTSFVVFPIFILAFAFSMYGFNVLFKKNGRISPYVA